MKIDKEENIKRKSKNDKRCKGEENTMNIRKFTLFFIRMLRVILSKHKEYFHTVETL